MKAAITSIPLVLISFACVSSRAVENWNQFRGPQGNGVSSAVDLPIEFDEAKNVRWNLR